MSYNKLSHKKPSVASQLWAMIKYELLWNIRKKKFLGVLIAAFIISTLSLTLPVVLSHMLNRPLESRSDYVITNSGLGNLMIFLFALVTVMNSISGEFESGAIVPLLTKPVSRTLVLIGKVIAALTTIFAAYTLLYTYIVIGGTVIYGPQNNLGIVPICMLADILSTFVWVSLILAISSLSRNTVLTAVTAIIIFLAMHIGSSIISVFSESAWILHYFPGNGASGQLRTGQFTRNASSISTGTDNISKMITQYILNPSANVSYVKIELGSGSQGNLPIVREIYSEPLSIVLVRALVVATLYSTVLMFIAWYAFKRAQIFE